MPGAYLWAWDTDAETYRKVLVDADGKLIISDVDPFTIEQTDPAKLKHAPQGYDTVGLAYHPLRVDSDGKLQIAIAALAHLNDIDDVYVPSPTDGYILYWDAATSLWKCKSLVGSLTLNDLSDVYVVSPGDRYFLYWDEIAYLWTCKLLEVSDIPAAIARYTEVTDAIGNHTAIAAAHHTKTIDASELTTGELPTARLSTNIKTLTITFIIDGGGSAITTGQKGHLEIPFACTLTGWTLVADAAGAIVIDVWKDTYANFPPTNNDAMPGAGKEPTIAATNQKAQDTDISDWTSVAIAAGSVLAFNVDSCTTITRVTLSLKATKT